MCNSLFFHSFFLSFSLWVNTLFFLWFIHSLFIYYLSLLPVFSFFFFFFFFFYLGSNFFSLFFFFSISLQLFFFYSFFNSPFFFLLLSFLSNIFFPFFFFLSFVLSCSNRICHSLRTTLALWVESLIIFPFDRGSILGRVIQKKLKICTWSLLA